MNFKNKIFITFFILLVFVLFFNISIVFASDDVSFTGYDGNTYTIPNYQDENFSQYLSNGYIIKIFNGKISLLLFEEKPHLYTSGGCLYSNVQYAYCDLVDGSWVNSGFEGFNLSNYFMISSELLYSTIDFYSSSSTSSDIAISKSGDNFFHCPGVEIPALETAEQIPQAIATTLKILIPVGLIVLSIGLVIYLIRRVRYSIM